MNDDEQSVSGSGHHVAWADRIGLNKQWAKDIISCSESYGTPFFVTMVDRFRNNIINIKNGPQLKTIIDDFIEGDLSRQKEEALALWIENNKSLANNHSIYLRESRRIDELGYSILYNFMLQLLEDNNFCFYESNIEEDSMS